MIAKEKFAIEYQGTKLIGDIMPAGVKPKFLILHGAKTSISLYEHIRITWAEQNISSIAFDFIGNGETGGDMLNSNLEDRANQVKSVIEKMNLSEINILAASMGAYVAIKLTQFVEVKTLILLVPGIYDKRAYKVNFGQEFTKIIRQPNSWLNSDAWEVLESFKGNLLIVQCGRDQVVPAEIPQRIIDASSHAIKKETYFS